MKPFGKIRRESAIIHQGPQAIGLHDRPDIRLQFSCRSSLQSGSCQIGRRPYKGKGVAEQQGCASRDGICGKLQVRCWLDDKTARSGFEQPQVGPGGVSGKDAANNRKRIRGDTLGWQPQRPKPGTCTLNRALPVSYFDKLGGAQTLITSTSRTVRCGSACRVAWEGSGGRCRRPLSRKKARRSALFSHACTGSGYGWRSQICERPSRAKPM